MSSNKIRRINRILKILRQSNEKSVSDLAEVCDLPKHFIDGIEAGVVEVDDDIVKLYSLIFDIEKEAIELFFCDNLKLPREGRALRSVRFFILDAILFLCDLRLSINGGKYL